jgi:hypothetical protein
VPLKAAQEKALELDKSTSNYEKDIMGLRNARGYLKDIKARTK